MLLSRQKLNTILLATLLSAVIYLARERNISQGFTFTLARDQGQHLENIIDESWLAGPIALDDPRLLKVIKERHLVPPSTLPYNLSSPEDIKRYYPASNVSSFHFIDYYIKLLLGDQKTGFFLDSGALEGEIFSNSLWLEKERGWTGVLVEVDPNNFRHLVQKRRKSWLSNTCIARVPYPQQVPFEFLEGPPDHRRLWVYRSNSRAANSPFSRGKDRWSKTAIKTYKVMQCLPLASYILALGRTTLDFLSLDIQGFEDEVLLTIPFDKVTVRVIAVEYYFEKDDGSVQVGRIDHKFVKQMEDKGYLFVDLSGSSDYIFALKNDTRLKGKLDHYVKFRKMISERNKQKDAKKS